MLANYALGAVYISDINCELINTYLCVRDQLEPLLNLLEALQSEFLFLDNEARRPYYYTKRARFNSLRTDLSSSDKLELAALFIFLNRTCFNGLYRVNKQGDFNVPIGSYKKPTICDTVNLTLASKTLKGVEIVCADYRAAASFIDERTFVYFDPPYRPLTATANFTSYSTANFDDSAQIELANFIADVDKIGASLLLSNSDPKNALASDDFFDELYKEHTITRIEANRMINSKADARGKISELLIVN